jgi:hypothetical protein
MRRSFQTVSLQRQSKALTRMRLWSRCEQSLLSTPGIAGRFNRYDKRCRETVWKIEWGRSMTYAPEHGKELFN